MEQIKRVYFANWMEANRPGIDDLKHLLGRLGPLAMIVQGGAGPSRRRHWRSRV